MTSHLHLRAACGILVLASLGACAGVGGMPANSDSERAAALEYPEFRAQQVVVSRRPHDEGLFERTDRDNYFAAFEDHVHIGRGVLTRMGSFQFDIRIREAAQDIQVFRDGRRVVLDSIPQAFYLGDVQAAALERDGAEYLLLAANTPTATNRRWIGIYRADGIKMYAASLDRPVIHVRRNDDGISLFFRGGGSLRIQLP